MPGGTPCLRSSRRRRTSGRPAYSAWCGQWSSYWGDDTWQPLPRTSGAHQAAADGLAVLALLDRLAADLPAAVAAAAPIHVRRAALLEERDRQRRAARGADEAPF